MPSLDVTKLIDDIKTTTSGIIGKDVETVNGFSDYQLKGIAAQANLVAGGIQSGEISGENTVFFLEQLEELAKNFARAIVGMILVTVEKVANAIIKIIKTAISTVTGGFFL